MSNLSIPNTIANGTAADGNDVDANFDAIKAWADSYALEKGGGTLTGNLVLAGDPSSALMAATKQYVDNSVPPGVMQMYGGSAAPTGWLLCQGQAVSRSTYASLYAIIGTTFGVGDGSTTFNLPDLRTRFPVGYKSGDSNFGTLGGTGGATSFTLAEANLPSHTHSINHDHASATTSTHAGHTHPGSGGASFVYVPTASTGYWNNLATSSGPNDEYYADALNTGSGGSHDHTLDLPSYTGTSGSGSGSGTAKSHIPPYVTVNFIIKT